MGSTNYLNKPKSAGYRIKSGSSVGSDKELNNKLKRNKIRRPSKITDYGMKRVPDYTELAYKEAVSKLRYFLSGNYAPSMRSYGGSASIKNLDDSDGDLDKKYSPYGGSGLTSAADVKPRPRLTAKYTTLYADSLNNYTPPQTKDYTKPVTSPGAADVNSANPDVVNFIQKQEEYIEQLERESQYCRDELNNLLGKVKEVISENENLHEAQKNKLISRMFTSYAGSETDELDDSTGLDSDNKLSPSNTRKSSKYRSSKLEGPNIVFESRIAELEAQLTQARIDMKKIQEENNENKRKLASGLVDSTCLDGFKRQIDNLQRDKSALEAQISKLKLSLETRDEDGRHKRNDALEHQLRDERNSLEAEMRRLKEELSSERNKLRELAGESARRAERERSAAEHRYHAHFDELQHDLAAQYDNVAKLQLELERQRRDENDLKRELSMKSAAIEELKMELKNKSSSLQADLAQAHAEKASLEEELASARLAMERHQRQAKHETNRLNSEIQSLRQRLDRADADLVHSRRENLRLSEQISNLEKEINMKNLTPISPEKNRKEKELSSMMESMENKHAKTVAELESMIQSQNSLMEKLTGECRLLTDKLDDANRRHKSELANMQRQVDTLGRSLQSTPRNTHSYEAPPPHPAAAYGDVPPPPGAGRDHPGTEPAGYTPDRVRPHDLDHQAPGIVKQDSRTSLHSNNPVNNSPVNVPTHLVDSTPVVPTLDDEIFEKPTRDTDFDKTELQPEYEESKADEPQLFNEADGAKFETGAKFEPEVKYEPEAKYEPQAKYEPEPEYTPDVTYEEPKETPVEETPQYDPNYQNYEQTEYPNQQYEQGYEQPTYTDGQYENYEQYPQQYTDPNAQYQGNYENYPAEGNYEQAYPEGQYEQGYQQTPQIEGQIESDKNGVPEQS